MTEGIKHINKKNQEYIAEGNRMTEEIIIDGVNVAGCEYFAKQNEHSCLEENGNCKNISDCYYKQLKRLEQERDGLKETINKFRWDNPYFDLYNNVVFQRDKLEQENKELKNKNICRETCEYFKRICNENTLLIKYRSALEEIRILATKNVSIENFVKIQNKINEVLQ